MSDNIPTPPPPPAAARDDRTRTHIKAVMQAIKDNDGHNAAQPAGLFMSGMLTGLASGIEILDGGTAEKALETVGTRLAAAIGEAYLAGNLPPQPPQAPDATTPDQAIRGVQASLALDLHQALGLPIDHKADHQGHATWADWWANLCAHVAQRTHAERAHTGALADPYDLHTGTRFRRWQRPSVYITPEPEDLFFPIAYGAVIAEAHRATPADPPYMIDLTGYSEGDPVQQKVHRLIVHRSLITALVRDLAALEPSDSAPEAAVTPDRPREPYAALAFNAVDPALKAHNHWLPLSVRRAVAEAVLAVRDREMEQLRAVFDENARRHKAAIDRVDKLLAAIDRVREWKLQPHPGLSADELNALTAALTEPKEK